MGKISQIRTLSVERIGKKIGHLSPDILDEIVVGLNEIIGSQIDCFVIPDLIRYPETTTVQLPGFRLVGRNDKSLRDN
ncbi:MAG: hypothetical protein PHG91_13305 [Syntrophales bacterium]|nr:hypothetical protein [Syntrophales bacterium]MDD5234364.1 hypothetical protein [Syntrophales bacterium]